MKAVQQPWKVFAALLIVYVVWGTTHYATLIAVKDLPPVLMTGARFCAAGVLMMAFAGAPALHGIRARQVFNCAVAGALMSFASMTLAVLAIFKGVASGLMACIVATMPVWLTLFAQWGGERTSARAWLGVLVGVVGAGLLCLDGNLYATPTGTALAFLSPICWAAGTHLIRRSDMPPIGISSALQWLSGGLTGLAVGVTTELELLNRTWSSISLPAFLAWGYLVVFGTVLTYTAYIWLVRNVSAPLAGSSSYVNPVIAVVVGGTLAGEKLEGISFFSLALILISLALIIYTPSKSR